MLYHIGDSVEFDIRSKMCRYPHWRLDPKTIDIGAENVDWNCQRRFEFYFLIRGFITRSVLTQSLS